MYKNDVGVKIIYNVLEDISSSATEVGFVLQKPDDTEVILIGAVENKSRIVYTTKAGDVNQTGKYSIQPYVKGANSTVIHGEIKFFTVSEPL